MICPCWTSYEDQLGLLIAIWYRAPFQTHQCRKAHGHIDRLLGGCNTSSLSAPSTKLDRCTKAPSKEALAWAPLVEGVQVSLRAIDWCRAPCRSRTRTDESRSSPVYEAAPPRMWMNLQTFDGSPPKSRWSPRSAAEILRRLSRRLPNGLDEVACTRLLPGLRRT